MPGSVVFRGLSPEILPSLASIRPSVVEITEFAELRTQSYRADECAGLFVYRLSLDGFTLDDRSRAG